MTYTNEKCPVCNKRFNENDDIVVCPDCGTPHHRQCYLENKSCKNEQLHSQGFEWASSATEETEKPVVNTAATVNTTAQPLSESTDDGHKMVFCPNCGKENPAEEPVCRYCSERLYNNGEKGVLSQPVILPDMSTQQFGTPVVQISPDDTIGGNKVSDTAEYIQLNANRYIPKFYKMEKTGKKLSFNWAAFLFSPYWFFFRKMHVIGFVLVVILLATTGFCNTDRLQAVTDNYTNIAESYYAGDASYEEMTTASKEIIALPETVALVAVELAVRLFAGFTADSLYKKKAEKDIKEVKQKASSPEEYRLMIFKKGGISGSMCVLAIVAYYCAEQLIYTLMAKM